VRRAQVASASAAGQSLLRHTGVMALSLLAACATTGKRDNPIPLQPAPPVASAADERLSATIDAVIVRDGPGSWAKSADWDEFLLRLRSSHTAGVEIWRVVVVDSLGGRHRQQEEMGELKQRSKETARRYEGASLQVSAGAGGGSLLGAGAGVATAAAVAGVTSTSAAVIGTATAAIVVAPVLVAAGTVSMFEEAEVQREMTRRRGALPLHLDPGQAVELHLFFPLAPAPQRMEVMYADASGGHVLVVDTREALAGLHLLQAHQLEPGNSPPAP